MRLNLNRSSHRCHLHMPHESRESPQTCCGVDSPDYSDSCLCFLQVDAGGRWKGLRHSTSTQQELNDRRTRRRSGARMRQSVLVGCPAFSHSPRAHMSGTSCPVSPEMTRVPRQRSVDTSDTFALSRASYMRWSCHSPCRKYHLTLEYTSRAISNCVDVLDTPLFPPCSRTNPESYRLGVRDRT